MELLYAVGDRFNDVERVMRRLLTVLTILMAPMAAVAQSDKAGTTISLDPYETLIRPFMTAHCVKCHNAEKNKGRFGWTTCR